jgi:hypothetical protein
VLAGFTGRNKTSDARNRGQDQLLTSPSLVASPNHLGIEVNLREADSGFNAARAAGWRFATTAEPEQENLLVIRADSVIAALKRARLIADENAIRTGIDRLIATADHFKTVAGDTLKAEETKMRVLNERVFASANEIGLRIGEAVSKGTEYTAKRQGELLAELDRVATIALVVGVLVVLTLIGSALFALSSEIRRDTFVLPVAVTCRFRPFRALIFFRGRLGVRRGGLPTRFGFGERALCRRRQRLSCRGRGRSWP